MALPRTPLDRLVSDVVVPMSFDARYGDGLTLAVSFGGGGLFFVAWQIAYLSELAAAGVDVAGAQRIVGTSAGSLVAAVTTSGRLRRVQAELAALSRVPALLAVLAPSEDLHLSQLRALGLFYEADDAEPATVRAIGHAALAADTPSAPRLRRSTAIVTGRARLTNPVLHVTAVDAYTAERCVLGAEAGTTLAAATAASSAVPGLFTPQSIGDRSLMDGGVSGTGVHLDLVAGATRALVLSRSDGTEPGPGAMTCAAGSFLVERAALEAAGTEVFARSPEPVEDTELMAPASVPKALAMGARQARGDIEDLRSFLR